jgi:hypothetical protein
LLVPTGGAVDGVGEFFAFVEDLLLGKDFEIFAAGVDGAFVGGGGGHNN